MSLPCEFSASQRGAVTARGSQGNGSAHSCPIAVSHLGGGAQPFGTAGGPDVGEQLSPQRGGAPRSAKRRLREKMGLSPSEAGCGVRGDGDARRAFAAVVGDGLRAEAAGPSDGAKQAVAGGGEGQRTP